MKLKDGRATLVLLLCCVALFSVNAYFAWHVQYIGFTDSAQYGELGKSVAEGHWFTINTVKFFFNKWPSSITHPDDIYDPLQPLLLGLLFKLFGTSVFVANIPSMVFAFIVTPLLAFFLAKRFVPTKYAFIVGFMTLLNPLHQALYCWADPMFASLTLAGILCFSKAQDNPKWYVWAAIVFGLAALARRTGYLYGAFFVIAAVYHWRKGSKIKAAYATMGIPVFMLTISPWLIRNYLVFGNPLQNVYTYARFLIGYFTPSGYNLFTSRVFWDETINFHWLLQQVGWSGVWHKALTQTATALLYFWPLHLAGLLCWKKLRFEFKTALVIYFVSLIVVANYGIYVPRYSTPFIPLFFLIGMILWLQWMKTPKPWLKTALRIALACAIAFLVMITIGRFFMSVNYKNFSISFEGPGYPRVDDPRFLPRLDVAKWVDQNLPQDAVIMTSSPHDLNFYTGRKALKIPIDTPDRIKEVLCYYRVTYVEYYDEPTVTNTILPQSMASILKDPAFHVVYNDKSTIYAVDKSYCAGSP